MECQSTQAVLEGKESVELLYVEKFVKGDVTAQLHHSNCSSICCYVGTTPMQVHYGGSASCCCNHFLGKSGADLLAYESAVNRDLSKAFLLLKLGGDSSVTIAA